MTPFLIFMIVFNAALLLYYAVVILSDYTNLKKKQSDKAEVINTGDAESPEDSGPKQVTQDPESGNIDIKDTPREIKPEEAIEISEPEEAEASQATTSESISHEADGQQAEHPLPAAPSVEKEEDEETQTTSQSDNQSSEAQHQTPSGNTKGNATTEIKEDTKPHTSEKTEKQEQPKKDTQPVHSEENREPEPSPAVKKHAKDITAGLESIRRCGKNANGHVNLRELLKDRELARKKNIATKDEVYKL